MADSAAGGTPMSESVNVLRVVMRSQLRDMKDGRFCNCGRAMPSQLSKKDQLTDSSNRTRFAGLAVVLSVLLQFDVRLLHRLPIVLERLSWRPLRVVVSELGIDSGRDVRVRSKSRCRTSSNESSFSRPAGSSEDIV